MKRLLVFILLGITFAITVTIGPYMFGVSHSVNGETRVMHAAVEGRFLKGQSKCIWGCRPDSKVENFETLDMSSPDVVALSATRSGGEVTLDVGLHKSFSTPNGKLAVDVSAVKSLRDEDAIWLLKQPMVKRLSPNSIDRMVRDFESRNNLSPNSFTKPATAAYPWDRTPKILLDSTTRKGPSTSVVSSPPTETSRVFSDKEFQIAVDAFRRQLASKRSLHPIVTTR